MKVQALIILALVGYVGAQVGIDVKISADTSGVTSVAEESRTITVSALRELVKQLNANDQLPEPLMSNADVILNGIADSIENGLTMNDLTSAVRGSVSNLSGMLDSVSSSAMSAQKEVMEVGQRTLDEGLEALRSGFNNGVNAASGIGQLFRGNSTQIFILAALVGLVSAQIDNGQQGSGDLLGSLSQQASQLPLFGNLMPVNGRQQQGQQNGLLSNLPLNGGGNNNGGLLDMPRGLLANTLNGGARLLSPNGQLQSMLSQASRLPLNAMSGVSGGLSSLANRVSPNSSNQQGQNNPMLQGLPVLSDLANNLSGRSGLLQNVLPGGQNTQGRPVDGLMNQARQFGQGMQRQLSSSASMGQNAAQGAARMGQNAAQGAAQMGQNAAQGAAQMDQAL
ncbi:hypothetical protein GZH46_01505 [Fragariocoptes setiger]|uniref:Uncharacterized protein n=1 Tax=Fragariocoptes setiger TaxID=1670756 RepID=A0ABQ7S994_9ACAR|nr:hypothetical protein GZH46_01505 [Fragariocoptes setiger]